MKVASCSTFGTLCVWTALQGCASAQPSPAALQPATPTSRVVARGGEPASANDLSTGEHQALESMHRLVPPKDMRVVDVALIETDFRGMPSTWGQSMRSRLLHKVVRAKNVWVRVRSQDEIEDATEQERRRPVGEQRYGEVRFVLEESLTDAKVRVAVREIDCVGGKTLVTVPAGRVGTDENELYRLRTLVEKALVAAVETGFLTPYSRPPLPTH